MCSSEFLGRVTAREHIRYTPSVRYTCDLSRFPRRVRTLFLHRPHIAARAEVRQQKFIDGDSMNDTTPESDSIGTQPHPGYWTEIDAASSKFGSIGHNVRIAKNCTLIGMHNIHIGDFVTIDGPTILCATVGRISIGRNAQIAAGCHLSGLGGIDIGDFCQLSPGVHIYSSDDDTPDALFGRVPKPLSKDDNAPVRIGGYVVIDAYSVILPGCDIGDGVSIKSMTLVATSLAPWTIHAGVPAALVGTRSQRFLTTSDSVSPENPQ